MTEQEIEYTESDLWILNNVLCCACRKPLTESKHINGVTVNKKARWSSPSWGNILLEDSMGRAIGFVCDPCVDTARSKDFPIPILYVVEIDEKSSEEKSVKYHLITQLEDVPPIKSCPQCGTIGYFKNNQCDHCKHIWEDQKDHR